MQVPYYVVHAFTSTVFAGNPAGVCVLEDWLPDDRMQRIAAENRLSETAFLLGGDARYELRWFTPTIEVDLCGHATLASGFILMREYDTAAERIEFATRSAGTLSVEKRRDMFALDFPSRPGRPCPPPPRLLDGLGAPPREVLHARDYLAVFDSEDDVLAVTPDFAALATLDCTGVIITAPGTQADFVSRFFAPAVGVDEDPVTGSAHCTLVPYWADRLGKHELTARQISPRGGELFCEYRDDRCIIAGHAALYLRGTIMV